MYSPISASVTLKKNNVSLLGTQVALIDLAIPFGTEKDTFGTKATVETLRIFIHTLFKVKSGVKMKLQLSSSFRDPMVTCLVVLETRDASFTVLSGGGLTQVMLPPTISER